MIWIHNRCFSVSQDIVSIYTSFQIQKTFQATELDNNTLFFLFRSESFCVLNFFTQLCSILRCLIKYHFFPSFSQYGPFFFLTSSLAWLLLKHILSLPKYKKIARDTTWKNLRLCFCGMNLASFFFEFIKTVFWWKQFAKFEQPRRFSLFSYWKV